MRQVKIIQGTDIERKTNEFLATVESEAFKSFTINESGTIAVIQYEVIEKWVKALCCDCQYWDDGGDASTTSGLCHECGQRRRFNSKACKCFKDIRG